MGKDYWRVKFEYTDGTPFPVTDYMNQSGFEGGSPKYFKVIMPEAVDPNKSIRATVRDGGDNTCTMTTTFTLNDFTGTQYSKTYTADASQFGG